MLTKKDVKYIEDVVKYRIDIHLSSPRQQRDREMIIDASVDSKMAREEVKSLRDTLNALLTYLDLEPKHVREHIEVRKKNDKS